MTLTTQFILFLYSLFIGIYLGVTYDLFYYFIFMHVNKYLKYFFDVIFFVAQGFIVFQVIFQINHGIVPFYSYFLFALGFLIYYKFQEYYYENTIKPLKHGTYKIFQWSSKVLHYIFVKPFIDTYHFFWGILKGPINKLKGLAIYVKKKFKRIKKQKAPS